MLEKEYFMKKTHKIRALARVAVAIALVGSAFSGCLVDKERFSIVVPDGAPALALAKLMSEDEENDGVSYTVVDASTIAARVTNRDMEKNADFCVLPVTVASKLLGSGEKYRMLGLVTQGNLYLVSKKFSAEVDVSNPIGLYGKTLGAFKMNEVPGLTLMATLERLGIAYTALGGGETAREDALNLQAVDAKGVDGSLDYYLVAEPQASKLKKAGFALVGDLQALYARSSGEYGYPQAVLVVKTEILDENAGFVKSFVEKVANAGEWLYSADAEQIFAAVTAHFDDELRSPSFSVETLKRETLERCGIRFSYAWECKERVNEFLSEMIAVNERAATIPLDGFYQRDWQE